VAAAAALAGTTPTQEMSTVDGLVAAHLLTEPAPGRYTCHDLLRRYATERVRDDDSAAERAAATRRLYDHYTATVDAAVDLLKPGVVRLAREPVDPAANPVSFDDRAQALAWMDAERPNLVAAVIAAADHGPRAGAWHLADAMRGYFWLHIALPDWLPVAQAGLTAAEAGGDAPAHAAMRLNLADALARQDRCRDAIPHYRLALDLYGRSGDAEGEAAVANHLAIPHGSLGEPRQAAGYLERALLIRRQLGQQLNEASALLNLAYVNYPAGQVAAAADYAAQAV